MEVWSLCRPVKVHIELETIAFISFNKVCNPWQKQFQTLHQSLKNVVEIKKAQSVHFISCQFQLEENHQISGIQSSLEIGKRLIEVIVETKVNIYKQSNGDHCMKKIQSVPLIVTPSDQNIVKIYCTK